MPINEDSLADFELLDYWYRYPLVPGSLERDREFRQAYVRLGFSYPYLLNSILALMSLRRFEENRNCTHWYFRGVTHQQAAIRRSRPHFHRLDDSHHKAILAFSVFTSLYAMAEPLRRPAGVYNHCDKFDPIGEFVHAVRLSRASTAFVQQHLRPVTSSDSFMAVKYSPNQLVVARDLDSNFAQLLAFRKAIQGTYQDHDYRTACLDAVERLFTCMKILLDNTTPTSDYRIMVLFAWIKDVDSMFWDMCSARHPVALVTLGYFAALMSLNQGYWLLQHWPPVLLRYIQENVDDCHWRDLLRWPTGIVFRTDGVPRVP